MIKAAKKLCMKLITAIKLIEPDPNIQKGYLNRGIAQIQDYSGALKDLNTEIC
jgi:hypothetical protein